MKSLLFEERVTLAVLSIYIKRGNRTIPKFNRKFLRVCVCVSLEEVYFFWKIFIFLDLRLIDDTEIKFLFQFDSDVTRQNEIYSNASFSKNGTTLSAHIMEKQNDRRAHRCGERGCPRCKSLYGLNGNGRWTGCGFKGLLFELVPRKTVRINELFVLRGSLWSGVLLYLASTVLSGLYFWNGCLKQPMNLSGIRSTCVADEVNTCARGASPFMV